MKLTQIFLVLFLYSFVVIEVLGFAPHEVCPGSCECFDAFLNCHEEGLTSPPAVIPQNIAVINLSVNKIKNLTGNSFSQWKKDTIIMIDLSHNYIEIIENETFKEFKQLKVLYLNFNRISDLSSTIFPSSLGLLHLDHNSLKIVNGTLLQTPHLIIKQGKSEYLEDNVCSTIFIQCKHDLETDFKVELDCSTHQRKREYYEQDRKYTGDNSNVNNCEPNKTTEILPEVGKILVTLISGIIIGAVAGIWFERTIFLKVSSDNGEGAPA